MNHPNWLHDYSALRDEAGFVSLADWTVLEFQGRDRATFLHNFCTNSIRDLTPGQKRELFITDVKGHVIGHGNVFATEESLLYVTVPGQAEQLIKHFDRYIIREQVTLHDLTQEKIVCSLSGSKLPGFMSSDLISKTGVNQFEIDWLKQPNKVLICSREEFATLQNEFLTNGFRQCCYEAFNALRIENGTPFFGIDISSDNLPQEVHRDAQAINFTKGCYLGQETVARIDALGHVNRLLVGVQFDSQNENLASSELTSDGKPIGQLTSTTFSPQLSCTLGLGYVKRQFAQMGSTLNSENIFGKVIKFPIDAPVL